LVLPFARPAGEIFRWQTALRQLDGSWRSVHQTDLTCPLIDLYARTHLA
jgi:hypothetical protein